MKATDFDLSKMLNFDYKQGKLLFNDSRMLIFNQQSFGQLRKLLHDQVGEKLAKALMVQFGYWCGVKDYYKITSGYEWDSEEDKCNIGIHLHAWEGKVHIEIEKLKLDRENNNFHLVAKLHNSYEAESHLEEFGSSLKPVCHSITGYASGWYSAFFEASLLAVETKCVACGDSHCEYEVKPMDEWGEEAAQWKEALATSHYSVSRELEDKLKIIEQQRTAIRELSTPILEVWDDILVMPIVGVVDSARNLEIMNKLLETVVKMQSRCVILDVTGVEVVDTKTADYLLKVVQAASLLGTRCVLTGIQPAVAQTLVEIGADLSVVKTLRNLKAGLIDCIKYLHQEDVKKD